MDKNWYFMLNCEMRKLLALTAASALFTSTFLGTSSQAATKPVVNPLPSTLPVNVNGVITFANAEANFAQIPEVAWKRTQEVINQNPAVSIPTTIDIGPNTLASKTAILSGLDRLNKLFAGFRHVPSYTGIVYNAQDQLWAQQDAAKVFKKLGTKSSFARPENIKQQVQAGCEMKGAEAVNCGGGMSWDLRDGKSEAGGSYYGVQSDLVNGTPANYWLDAGKNVGPMTQVNHEGTHNYQITQFYNTPLGRNQNTSSDIAHAFCPWWFSEGHANAIGISTFMETLPDYLNVRNSNVTNPPGPRTQIPSFTASGLKTLLTSKQIASPENPNYMLGYSIGMAAVEALSAIGGPQSTLALYTLGAKGEKWDVAFKHVYGISWEEGSTVLSKVLAAEYAAKPMGQR